MAAITDKFNKAFNTTNPNIATVTATRSAAATDLVCDDLTGWPTDTGVHFSTYQLDTNGDVVAGTQTDWKGIVSGDTIGSLTRKAGAADSGNAIGDVVEMNPTGSWANDLMEGILAQHGQDGSHGAVTATSLSTDTLTERTSASGVTIDSMLVKDGKVQTVDALSPKYTKNDYKFSAYASVVTGLAASFVATKITFGTEEYDTGSNYDAVTNNRFVAPVSGYYKFEAAYQSGSGATGEFFAIYLYKNGSEYKRGTSQAVTGSNTVNLIVSPPAFFLAANDYIEVYGAQNSGGVKNTVTGASATYFGGHMVSTS